MVGKVCVFQGLSSRFGFESWILTVQVMLEFYTLQGCINSIPLGRTYWIKNHEGVAYRTTNCSPLDSASDVLIYVELLVCADHYVTTVE